MRRLSILVLTAILLGCAAEVTVPLVARTRDCVCPLKGPCCKTACPLRGAEQTFQSCGWAASQREAPMFVRWTALLDHRAGSPVLDAGGQCAEVVTLSPLTGFDLVPEQPPRDSFLMTA